MKLTTKLLTLLSASTVFSYSVQNELNKRLEINLQELGAAANCMTALSKFQDCNINITNLKNNKDTICQAINSEKCQTILKGGINAIPECKDLPKEVLATSPLFFEMLSSSVGLACSKDENGNYCPLSDVIISQDGKLSREEQEVQNAITETCKSKKCVDAAVDTLTRVEAAELIADLAGVNFGKQEVSVQNQTQTVEKSEYKKVLEYFRSDNCTEVYNPTAKVESSAYSAFSFYTVFLVTFAFVLSNFF
ncbi:hypothetical protein H8356DRAFT_1740080 [Neocallimastix lanati (nom. inval.)]|jgi:hypothetical protein|uniref:Uncharacterized protein n=1 Tax=Neocallimastix californiae TaxID=1754190 RepID=A0A1Y2D0Z8_9FUNG|nr:hypothetical protein H8356DRAFT_1740080 [Neocallimastix sp. JGI-2020a]ORY52806.1 hypothetical protein LY90DRAFT_702676 [Neocallimastix californiae]|eukprot:ORY52806.1 hypothetical protein LY90DRAFT_702676 [Neocallimastix californiae]